MRSKKLSKVDVYMGTYFSDLCEQGEPYNKASYTLFGYILLVADESSPEKLLLPRARQALKGWSSQYPQSSRTGADPQIWFLLAEQIAGFAPEAAAALLLQLDSYARPSEIVNLKRVDVIKPVSRVCSFWGLIFGNSCAGDRTKAGLQDDTVLLNSLDRDYAASVLSWVLKSSSENRLFPSLTLSAYEEAFRKARKQVGLAQFLLTPHCVRHSGPSIDFLRRSRTAEEIMARGRWNTLKSIQRYQKPGQMLSRMAKIPDEIWQTAEGSLDRALSKLKKHYGA